MSRSEGKDLSLACAVDRLDKAVSYLLVRDLNILSRLPSGAAGNDALRDAFFSLIPLLRPTVFCDVGANDGTASVQVRDLLPECEIHAFEANPEIHARHSAKLARRGVNYRNLAISDSDGAVAVHVPRTLSRAYVDGEIVKASVVEAVDTGKASLLLRDENATYTTFEVEGRSLDSLFPVADLSPEKTFFLWIDVEGVSETVLKGSKQLLQRTLAVFIESENFGFWREGSTAGGVSAMLIEAGFVPLARDREYDDKQFNMLFVAGRVADRLSPFLFDRGSSIRACLNPATEPAAPRAHRSLFAAARRLYRGLAQSAGVTRRTRVDAAEPTTGTEERPDGLAPQAAPAEHAVDRARATVSEYLQARTPVFVPCFNNPTYTGNMVRQLRNRGFSQIVLVDGGSNFPKMQKLLNDYSEDFAVVSLAGNPGPRHLLLEPSEFALLPRHFCVTDPDLEFNSTMPSGFLGDLAALAAREKIGKAGLALDLSDPAGMKDEKFVIGGKSWSIWDWEKQYWKRKLPPLRPGGDPVYRADIDTTFALYDKEFLDPKKYLKAVRVAGRFTCRHLPWYRDNGLPGDEEQFYRSSGKHSYYFS